MESQVRQNYHRDCEAATNHMEILDSEITALWSSSDVFRTQQTLGIKSWNILAFAAFDFDRIF
uniref:Uncharacterized protein n=1 Tax=Amphiprion percula TaxID=161767 RepID=A0A3P8RPJ5_AMPPE